MTFFTIVIPNRNNEQYIKSAIDSVLKQTSRDFFFLISDNHSTDSSLLIIDQYDNGLFTLVTPPSPLSYAEHLYWIVSQVQTPYVVFFAGDDILSYDLIKSYNSSLATTQVAPSFICSPFYSINAYGYIYKCKNWAPRFTGLRDDMAQYFLLGPICNISSVAWNVSILCENPYPTELLETAGNPIDWFLYIKLSLNYPVLLINNPLLYYRVHSHSTGNSNVIKHTSSCIKLFVYLLKHELFHCPQYLSTANSNIRNFRRVVSGGLLYRFSIKLKFTMIQIIGLLKFGFTKIA